MDVLLPINELLVVSKQAVKTCFDVGCISSDFTCTHWSETTKEFCHDGLLTGPTLNRVLPTVRLQCCPLNIDDPFGK
jgi:hypothetical protein